MPRRLRVGRVLSFALAVSLIGACGGSHNSAATRRSDFRNIQKIISDTSKSCRSSVAALADGVHVLSSGAPTGALPQTAQATVMACSQASDEEIQDLATLSVPADLRGLRLEDVSKDLTAWAADAVSAAKDVIALVANRTDVAALADFNTKTTDMERLAQSSQAALDAAAAAVKMPSAPLDLPSVGRPPP